MHTFQRSILAAVAVIAAPAFAGAQGRIVPRPCPAPRCIPAPCPEPRCVRPPAEWIERTFSEVTATLKGRVLSVQVREGFVNRGRALGEADYVFPLPRDAAFRDLALTIEGEPVTGEVLEAGKARSIYEAIVRQQRDPALVEWIGQGMLRARIFPLPPGEEREVTVRFDAVVPLEGDALRISYRAAGDSRRLTSVGAGGRGDDIAPPRATTGRRTPAGGDASFTLSYDSSEFPGAPFSPTHRLSVGNSGKQRTVEASGAGREVVILLPAGAREVGSTGVLAHRPEPDAPGFMLLTLTPPAVRAASMPRDVTFVLDVSGSMNGTKMEQARAAGERLLETLGPDDRFRIVAFSTDVESFRPDFTPATQSGIREARSYLQGLRARGGTNISGALDEALDVASPAGRLPLVLILTDGAPTVGERDPDVIAERTAARRGRTRVFTLGLGSDVNSALVERLALQGQGAPFFVTPSEGVERTVGNLGERLTNPVLTDVRVTARGVRLGGVLPSGGQDLYAGQELVLLARWEGDGARDAEIRVEGMGSSGPVGWTTRVSLPARDRGNAFVGRLWATRRMGWLSAERRLRGSSAELDDEIRELGLRFGIPTELTSYLVLEPGMEHLTDWSASAAAPPGDMTAVRRALPGGVQGKVAVRGELPVGAPAPRPMTSDEVAFGQARQAAEQRAAASAADLEVYDSEEVAVGGYVLRRMADGVWKDVLPARELPRMEVRAWSAAWFRLIELRPELKDVLALGDRVEVVLERVVLVVGEVGLEELGSSERLLLTGQ